MSKSKESEKGMRRGVGGVAVGTPIGTAVCPNAEVRRQTMTNIQCRVALLPEMPIEA